jgi:hypothetical protein
MKLLDHGEQREPFLAKTAAPSAHRYGRRENLIRRSRERYATSREIVEDKIARWIGNDRWRR